MIKYKKPLDSRLRGNDDKRVSVDNIDSSVCRLTSLLAYRLISLLVIYLPTY